MPEPVDARSQESIAYPTVENFQIGNLQITKKLGPPSGIKNHARYATIVFTSGDQSLNLLSLMPPPINIVAKIDRERGLTFFEDTYLDGSGGAYYSPLSGQIAFPGFVSENDMPSYLRAGSNLSPKDGKYDFLTLDGSRLALLHEIGHAWELGIDPKKDDEETKRIKKEKEERYGKVKRLAELNKLPPDDLEYARFVLDSEAFAHNFALAKWRELKKAGIDLEPNLSDSEAVQLLVPCMPFIKTEKN